MLELTAGTIDRPFRKQHAAASIVSVTSHVVVLGSIVGAPLFTVPDEASTLPPPPPSSLSPVRAKREPQPATPAPASGPTFHRAR